MTCNSLSTNHYTSNAMNRPLARYLGMLTVQTVVACLLGVIWLANAIYLGEVAFGSVPQGCGNGILNMHALVWQILAIYGFPVTIVHIFSFGFLLSWLLNGQRLGYVLAIFLCPLFGLTVQNVSWSSESLQYFVNALGPFVLYALLIAALFVPGFNYQRRLANRSTGSGIE